MNVPVCICRTERIIHTVLNSRVLPDLEARTVRNISFVAIAQLVSLLLTVIMIAALTRILTPADFGIVSISFVIIGLFALIQDFGVAPAIVQRDSRIDEAISAGLAIRWVLAVALLALLCLFAVPIGDFYGYESLSLVLVVMSLNLFLQPLAFSSYVVLTRKLMFSRLATAMVGQNVMQALVALTLAFIGFSYWSLVFGSLAGSGFYVLILNHYEHSRHRPSFDRALSKELMGFGSHLLVTALMVFIILNIDQLVIGKVLGVTALGVYFVSVKFGRSLGEQVSNTVNKVLFPTMARMKNSIENLRIGYCLSLRMIAVIVVPIAIGISALSPNLVEVVLGEDFGEAVIPIAILSIQGLFNALTPSAANVLVAIGAPKYLSVQSTVHATLIVATIYPIAMVSGVVGVCILTLVLSVSAFGFYLVVLSRKLNMRFRNMISPMAPCLISGALVYALLRFSMAFAPVSVLSLIGLAFVGGSAYVLFLHVLSNGRDVRDVISLISRSFWNGGV